MAATALSRTDEIFVEDFAKLLMPMGMPPIAARVHGVLFIAAEPLTLDELAEALNASKSSISVAARLLERYGVARRIPERGSKRVRYALASGCPGFLYEQVEFLGAMGRLLRARGASMPGDDGTARLVGMGNFYLRVRDALDTALRER